MGVKSYEVRIMANIGILSVLVTEMVFPPSLFEEQFQIWHLRGSCCGQACSRYEKIQRRGTMGNVHLLFIYKLAVLHHVKLTPLMGSCLSCLKDGLSPAKATHWLLGSFAVCLLCTAGFMEPTC